MAAVPDGGSKDKPSNQGGGAVDGLTPPTMKYADAQKTQIGPPQTMGQAPSISNKQQQANKGLTSSFGGATNTETVVSDVAVQDLSSEKLLRDAPRIESNGHTVPSLNGIPMLAKLGQGGMGAVYYGIHPRLRSEVAVKVLPFHLAEQDPGMIRRFFREAQIAAQVRSPHLVNVMDVNEEAGLFFLVMEFVPGVTAGQYLKALLEKGQPGMAEADALDVIIAATEGLLAAHKQGVVHRDLKPDNIMVPYLNRTEKNFDLKRAKLMDLGLARTEESNQSLTGAQAAMGTPGYMAPEQAMDAKTADKRSDVFGMGATIYALLAGRPPFRGEAIMKVLMATMHEPHEPITKHRPEISPALSELIDRCLDKKQENRFQDANQLLRGLRNCRRLLSSGGTVVAAEVAEDDDDDDGAPAVGAVPGGSGPAKTISGNARTVTGAPKTISGSARTVTNADDLEATLVGPGAAGAAGAARSAQLTPPPAKSSVGMYIGIGVAVLALGGGGAFFLLGNKPGNTDGKGNSKQPPVTAKTFDPREVDYNRKKFADNLTKANGALETLEEWGLKDAIDAMTAALEKLPDEDVKKFRPDLETVSKQLPTIGKRQDFRDKLAMADKAFAARDYDKALEILNKQIVPVTEDHQKQINAKKKQALDRKQFNEVIADAGKHDLDTAELKLGKLTKVEKLAETEDEKRRYTELHSVLSGLQQYADLLAQSKVAANAGNNDKAFDLAEQAYKAIPDRSEAREAKLKLSELLGEEKKKAAAEQRKKAYLDAIEAAGLSWTNGNLAEAQRQAQMAKDSGADEAQRARAQKILDDVQAKKLLLAETDRKKRITDALSSAQKVLADGADINPARTFLIDAQKENAEPAQLKPIEDALRNYDSALERIKAALQSNPVKLEAAELAVKDAQAIAPKAAVLTDFSGQIARARAAANAEALKAKAQSVAREIAGVEKQFGATEFDKARSEYERLKTETKSLPDAEKLVADIDAKLSDLGKRESAHKADLAFNKDFTASIQTLKPGKLSATSESLASLHKKHNRTELKRAAENLQSFGEIEEKFVAANARLAELKDKLDKLKQPPDELKDLRQAEREFNSAVKRLTDTSHPSAIALANLLVGLNPGVVPAQIDKWMDKIEKEAKKEVKVTPPVGNPGELDIEDKKPEKKTPEKKTPEKKNSTQKSGELDVFDQ